MKTKLFCTALLICPTVLLHLDAAAQDTFSIIAVDSATGEVGSAGASCVDLFRASITDPSFLGDLIPGKGAIVTQAYYLPANQTNARNRMNAGDTPEQIITWLRANDADADSSLRQYGIVALVNNSPRVAAHTGSNCLSYANHITGKNYSIQGNILLGQKVLDSMEARFNNTTGTLACKLMAALQGAKMVGADSRCTPNNTSSLFAFLTVSRPTDAYNSPYIKIGVRTPDNFGIEPIDSLQAIVNSQGLCNPTGIKEIKVGNRVHISPNPAADKITLTNTSGHPVANVEIRNTLGKVVIAAGKATSIAVDQLQDGIYYAEVSLNGTEERVTIKFLVRHPQ